MRVLVLVRMEAGSFKSFQMQQRMQQRIHQNKDSTTRPAKQKEGKPGTETGGIVVILALSVLVTKYQPDRQKPMG